jgi:glucosamine-6-phosphate deaminase
MKAEILRFDSGDELYPDLIQRLQAEIRAIRDRARDPVLALPTGNTMIPFYRLACKHEESLQISRWRCFQLDEYHPLTAETRALAFRQYLDEHFFTKLKTTPLLRESPDGFAPDADIECARYERSLRDSGGIDLAILGIGVNGHIAFNEPGAPFDSRTRQVTLHPETIRSNFKSGPSIRQAITLGIGTLLEAKKIWIIAASNSKAEAVRKALLGPLAPEVPASALQLHPDVTWFLDSEAGSLV